MADVRTAGGGKGTKFQPWPKPAKRVKGSPVKLITPKASMRPSQTRGKAR